MTMRRNYRPVSRYNSAVLRGGEHVKRRILTIAFWGVQALALLVVSQTPYQHWQEERAFGACRPDEHYFHAVRLASIYPYSHRSSDIDLAFRHLEAIPKNARTYHGASKVLPLLIVERDRPKEFEAAKRAYYRECMAEFEARVREREKIRPCPGITTNKGDCVIIECGNYIDAACSPLPLGTDPLLPLGLMLR
jgi:hypothetical protein